MAKIQVREEKMSIAKSHVAAAFGMSLTSLNRKILSNKIAGPTGKGEKYTKRDIARIVEQLGMPKVTLKGNGKKYFETLIQCNLLIVKGGVFLSPLVADEKTEKEEFKQMIAQNGLIGAQSLSNHVHLRDCGIRNPVLQLILAKHIEGKWLEQARMLKTKSTFLFEWIGKDDIVICISLMNRNLD